ncbi:translocation protein sec63 [Butyriboletus roseoflavus]|nr:translocation protein sec63 [Butyriboletus roseoflavus]
MANYHYDEAGNMAAYFLISVLAIILVPLTLSSVARVSASEAPRRTSQRVFVQTLPRSQKTGPRRQRTVDMQPQAHKEVRLSLDASLSFFGRPVSRVAFLLVGWSVFAFLVHRARNTETDTKLYNPYEILGISAGATEKEVKSLFRKLSKIYHPDKVKATVNQTVEQIANHFVDITKAYKALTDETIRRNYELYGHPDGRQEVSMGIALPSWIVEGKNNIWVLGIYAVLIGGLLPGMVGRWWFGSRGKTKDGIEAKTAEGFWKGVEEGSGLGDIVKVVASAFRYESWTKNAGDLSKVEADIEKRVGDEWKQMNRAVADDEKAQRALALLYAHFLRLDLGSKALEQEQTSLLLQTPMLLTAFLNIASARSWLTPALGIIRLNAYLIQALVPGKATPQAQLPGFDSAASSSGKQDLATFVRELKESGNGHASEASKTLESWGTLEIVDMVFKVIGERLVTPSSIVFLLVKLRVKEPGAPSPVQDAKSTKKNDDIDEKFLNARGDAEQVEMHGARYAHAPYWPEFRKPGWWLVLADEKSNRIVVPPLKISDVPFSDASKERNYRCYKVQFQAPPNVGLFTWKVYFVSDTLVGEETCRPITLKIDDVSALATEEQTPDDEISDPDEDSLAGQMAAMRGGSVKKVTVVEESDEDSSTDEEEEENGGNDSSDSD